MVQFAKQERLENKTEDVITKEAIKEKGALDEAILNTEKCDGLGGQSRPEYYRELLQRYEEQNKGENEVGDFSREDIKTGFMVFSAVIYCPKSAKETYQLYQFLDNLVLTESPRTIIQAVVNTIQAGALVEDGDRKGINEFYLAMDKHFRFQYGKILLATSTNTQLKEMLEKDWPFFDDFRTELVGCLNGTNCERIEDLIETLGGQF